MSSKIVLGLLLLLSFISGCGSGSGGSGASGSDAILTPAGNYAKTQDMDPSDPSFYSKGCQTPGQPTVSKQIDSQVRANLTWDLAARGSILGAKFVLTGTDAVTSVTNTTLTLKTTISKVFGIPGLNNGDVVTSQCTVGSDPFCIEDKPAAQKFTDNIKSFTNNCSLGNDTKFTSGYDKGTFVTAEGSTLNSYRFTENVVGTMTCPSFGPLHLTIRAVAIKSNDLPSGDSDSFCGGVTAFAALSMQKDDGTILLDIGEEVLGLGATPTATGP